LCVGWILMATQPGNGWHEGTVTSWSHSIGIMGLVHALGLWHGVLAFGFGLVLGMTLDTVPTPVVEPVRTTGTATEDAADDPLTAEREAAYAAEPKTVMVGPHTTSDVED
jgi:hypothetical protein